MKKSLLMGLGFLASVHSVYAEDAVMTQTMEQHRAMMQSMTAEERALMYENRGSGYKSGPADGSGNRFGGGAQGGHKSGPMDGTCNRHGGGMGGGRGRH